MMVISEYDLTALRYKLRSRIQDLLPTRIRQAPRGNRQIVIVEVANEIASQILKHGTSRVPTNNLALQTLTALYVSCAEEARSQLSYIVDVFEIVGGRADVSNLTSVLGALLIAAVDRNSGQSSLLTSALGVLLQKWPSHPDSWHPQHYVNIADTISVCASLHGADACLNAFTSLYRDSFETVSLPRFAVCAGLFNAVEQKNTCCSLIQILGSECLRILPVLVPLNIRSPRPTVSVRHIRAYCSAFIIASAGPKVAEYVPLSCVKTLTIALENVVFICLENTGVFEGDTTVSVLRPTFNALLLRFTAVYTLLSLRVRAATSVLIFVKELITSSAVTASKLVFLRIFAGLASSQISPVGNAHLLDTMAYTETGTMTMPITLVGQMTKCVARDMKALGLLAIATLLDLEVDTATEGHIKRHGLALAAYTSRALSARATYFHQKMFLCDGNDEEELGESLEEIWLRLACCLIKFLSSRYASNFVIFTNLIIALFGAKDIEVREAKKYAVMNCLCTLIEAYDDCRRSSLDDESGESKTALRCILAAVSGMALTVNERSLTIKSLKKLVCAASGSGYDAESVACICLLRYMQRCEIALVDIAMNCISDLVGPTKKRKLAFRNLISEYVLRMELGRKNKCLIWLIKEFTGVPTSSIDVSETAVTTPKNQEAKL